MIQLTKIKERINNLISTILEKKERSYKELGEVYHLSEYLPYKWYDEEKEVYVSENDVGIIFGVYPLVGNSESMQKELSNIFTQILPEGSNIQVMFYADKNIKDTLDDYVNFRKGSGETLEVLAERRAKHLEQCTLRSGLYPYVLRDFKGYISITIPIRNKVEETLEEITSIKKQISSTMNIVGVSHFILEPNELMRLIDGIFNRRLEEKEELKREWNSLEELNSQMISYETDLEVEEDLLKLHEGELEIKTFSISGYPGEWTLYQMGELIGDLYRDSKQFPYPYIFHYGIHIPKQSNGIAKIAVKANLVEKQLRSPVGKYIPNIEREHAELEFVQQNLTKGERLVQTQFSIVLFASKGDMANAEQVLRTLFSSKLFKVETNKGTHLHSLLMTLPLSWDKKGIEGLREFKKLRTTLSTESANLVPLQGEWKGTNTPGIILGGRRG